MKILLQGFLERNIAGAITRHPAMYPLLAELHDSQERSAVARKVLEEGLRRYPESEDLLYSYGAFLEQKSEHRAAMDIMQKLVAINPSNAAALNFVGYSWANNGINLQMALDYILTRTHPPQPSPRPPRRLPPSLSSRLRPPQKTTQ